MKQSKEALEIARQERERKHRKSVFYNSTLTPEDERMLQVYVYNLSSMRQLIKFGLDNFDDQGQTLVFDDDISGAKEYLTCGKTFLEEIISYFEQEDESYAYIYCAKAKEILDEYNLKFGH